MNRFSTDFPAAIARLKKTERDRLVADGLVVDRNEGGGEPDWAGKWTLKTTITRMQSFAAHAPTTVVHEYAPMTGGTVGGGLLRAYRNEKGSGFPAEARKYCIDDDWMRSFGAAAKRRGDEAGNSYSEIWIGYVLKTGANWKGPIRDFRLVVDKGYPDSLVSFCAEGLRKISATQFEARRHNFTPATDLNILIVDWRKD